jgi:hypothetical protein
MAQRVKVFAVARDGGKLHLSYYSGGRGRGRGRGAGRQRGREGGREAEREAERQRGRQRGRDGSAAKSTGYSSKDSKFSSQHPHSDLQPPTVLDPGNQMPSSKLQEYQSPTWCTCIHVGKAHTRKIKRKF